jgi:hypothetical protein
VDTENISCKKLKIKFCTTLGTEKVPVPQFTRRGCWMCVWDFDEWSRKYSVKLFLSSTLFECIQRGLIVSWNSVCALEYGIIIANSSNNTRCVVWRLKCVSIYWDIYEAVNIIIGYIMGGNTVFQNVISYKERCFLDLHPKTLSKYRHTIGHKNYVCCWLFMKIKICLVFYLVTWL